MELIDYVRIVRRNWLVLFVPLVVVPITAFVVSSLQPSEYRGSATMIVNESRTPTPYDGQIPGFSGYSQDRDLNTHMRAIGSADVLRRAAEEVGDGVEWDAIRGATSISNPANSNVMDIEVRWSDPRRASVIAAAVGSAYSQWTQERRQEAVAVLMERTEVELQEVLERTVEVSRGSTIAVTLASTGNGLAIENVSPTLMGDGAYDSLMLSLSRMSLPDVPFVGLAWVLESGVVDSSPVSPRPMREAALGAAVGLVLGLGLVFLVEYFRTHRLDEAGSVRLDEAA